MFSQNAKKEKRKRKKDSSPSMTPQNDLRGRRVSTSQVGVTVRPQINSETKSLTDFQQIPNQLAFISAKNKSDTKATARTQTISSPLNAISNAIQVSSSQDQQYQSKKAKRNNSSISSSLRRFIQATIGRSSNIITNGGNSCNSNASSSANTNNNSATINVTNKCDPTNNNKNRVSKNSCTTTSAESSSMGHKQCDTGTIYAVNISEPAETNCCEKFTIKLEECPLCVVQYQKTEMTYGASCAHRVCKDCMKKYITTEISHSRLSICCPVCPLQIHPNKIKTILNDEELYLKYENFMLRRVIAAEPDARWCPAPDCGYVVIASGCASCPELKCGRDGCNTTFCYHCKQEWHPNDTCMGASIKRGRNNPYAFTMSGLVEENALSQKTTKSGQQSTLTSDDIKECPVCGSRIIKMNDGSCNHMTCSICETEFCWLCMKEITDLHYFSPSGCTFWGKKPWSRKKKILWQLGMLAGAPVCIILIAGVAIPAIVIGIPVWAGRKLRNRLEREPLSKYRKNAIVTGGVLVSLLVSPLISAVALAVGVPILLGYVYGVVPISLCRSGGCGLSPAESSENVPAVFEGK